MTRLTLHDEHVLVVPELVIQNFGAMVSHWNSEEVLGQMSMGEGFAFADLLDEIGLHDLRGHVLLQVWEAEAMDSRDPKPWVSAYDGSRAAEHRADEEGWYFSPRASDWEADL